MTWLCGFLRVLGSTADVVISEAGAEERERDTSGVHQQLEGAAQERHINTGEARGDGKDEGADPDGTGEVRV